MPQVSNLTLAAASLSDSSTDEIYTVVDRREGVTTFRYVGDNPMALASRLTVAVKQPNANSKYAKVTLSFVKPESFTDSGTSLIEQRLINRATLEFQVDKNATISQITACTERMLAFLTLADVQQAVNNVENFY